jgi:hypothetical protein
MLHGGGAHLLEEAHIFLVMLTWRGREGALR